ncbi:MAG: COG1361 S-layer family protein [Candidatus Nanoarchaeia archaeon]|nr:COG1361 S-layer family protein [Candidatus Nanoarchaeia archaeon]
MNKKIFLILGLILTLISLQGVYAWESTQLELSLTRYEPLPAQPGQYVTVYVQIENDGSIDAQDAVLEILDSFPFEAVSDQDRIKNLGIIKSQDSYITNFKLKVDSNAVIGTNKLKVRYTPDKNSDLWMTRELSIEVKDSQATLGINQVELSPEQVLPGEETELTLTIKNSANVVFRELKLKLDLETTTATDLPFVPMNSASEKQVSLLKPGELTKVSFNLATYPTSTPGYYKLPLLISFYDDEGNLQEQETIIGVVISASPELKIVSEHIDEIVNPGELIRIKSINKGINDLKFLDIEVQASEDYKIVSQSESYIGDLDSDDYRTTDFQIDSKKEQYELVIKATFKDENNEEYQQTFNVPVKILEHKNGKSGISFGTIFFLIVIAGLGYYIYKLKNPKKKKIN